MAIGANSLSLLFRMSADATKAITEFKKLSSTAVAETNKITAAGKAGFAQTGAASEAMGASFLRTAKGAIAMGTAALGAATGLILFAKHTTQAAADLHDLSQQTGFQVETLSALKNAADSSGSSIGSVSTAIGIFQKNMIAAENGSKKMSAAFKALNIDTSDNEKALRQAFTALFQMKTGADQTAAAMQLFGRSGKDLLGIIKETNGNLDEAIKKYRQLGIIISTDDAKAADEFHDQLALMGKQLQAIGLQIGKVLIPIFQGLAIHINHLTMAFRGWALAIQAAKNALGGGWVENAMNQIAAANPQFGGAMAISGVNAALKAGGGVGTTPSLAPGGGGGRGGKNPQDAALEASVKAAELLHQKRLEDLNWYGVQFKRAYENQEQDLRTFTDASISLAKDKYNAEIDLINAELIALQNRYKSEEEYADRKAELDLEAVKALNKMNEEIGRAEDDFERKRSEAHFNALSRQVKWQEEADKRVMARIERDISSDVTSRSVGEQAIASVIEQGFQRRKQLLEEELNVFAVSAERRAAINDELISLEGDRAEAAEAASRRIRAAIAEEISAKLGQLAPGAQATPEGGIGAQIEGMIGPPPDMSPHIDAIKTFKDAATSAWGAISQGFGDMVYGFLMGEKLSGKAFAAMAKAAIASVAAQAAVHALFELGMGLASLWLNPLKAGAHFAAAKVFGTVALVAGVASLAIPGGGGATAGAPSSGGLRSSSSGGSGGVRSNEPRIIEQDRNRSQTIILRIESNDSHIVKTVVNNIRNAGDIRTVIKTGGTLAAA